MRSLRGLAIYLLAVFAGGALLAPLLFAAVQAAAARGVPLGGLPAIPFNFYVSRSLMIIAILGIWPLTRAMGIRSWDDLGFLRGQAGRRQLAFGFVLGFGTLALAVLLVVVAGGRAVVEGRTASHVLRHLVNATLAAGLVSVLEEMLFRGAILGSLERSLPRGVALLASSAIYALVHFFQRPPTPSEVQWFTGFTTLASMCRGFFDATSLIPGFLNLTVVGLILGLAFQRTGALWLSIGLHAGWIFCLKSYGFVTQDVPGANTWLWGSRRLIDGWAALLVLLPVLAWMYMRFADRGCENADVPPKSKALPDPAADPA